MNKNFICLGLILSITLTLGCVQTPTESYPRIGGDWILRHYDYEENLTNTENIRIVRENGDIILFSGDEILCNGTIMKNNLPYPQNLTEYIIRGCDFRGLGIDVIYIFNNSYLETELPQCESCNPSIFTRE
ncbi:MAG: hypothetical protein JSW60_02035 [Thermoplasmatales archaeon]|nr:MAG: hypothetical protein JSW60_02035 [Thermoplasmatales archaeon]